MEFRGLASDALEAALLALRRQERQLEVQVLHGLIEVERRRLHLDRGYGSIFTYSVEFLGYGESAAGRRIAAARALRRCPRIEGLLLAGEVHLSTVAMAAKEIAQDEGVLDRIRGKTQRQVEEILAAGKIREFKFEAGPAFREKFERARALLSRKHADGITPEQVLEAALDEYLKRHDPARPINHSPRGSDRAGPRRRSRAVPAAVRRAVWRRDGGRCTFMGPHGRRCGSTWDVEIDHVRPFCRGGEHRIGNLRLLCSAHNRRNAELELGTASRAPFHRRE